MDSLWSGTIEHMFALNLSGYDAAETLKSVARLRMLQRQIDAELLQHGQHFAELHPDPATIPGHETIPGGERGRVWGGPGCPGVAEFAAAEFGAAMGRSAGSAARYLGHALALQHRLPRIWDRVLSGQAEGWKACSVANACLTLSEDAAAEVDRRVADIVDTVTPLRLSNIVKAAIWYADPEAARAEAEKRARECGVWIGRTDDHGTTTLFLRAPTGDVLRLETTVRQIVDALAALGDTDSLDQRRAEAIGIISDPTLTQELLQVATHLTATQPPDTAAQSSGVELDRAGDLQTNVADHSDSADVDAGTNGHQAQPTGPLDPLDWATLTTCPRRRPNERGRGPPTTWRRQRSRAALRPLTACITWRPRVSVRIWWLRILGTILGTLGMAVPSSRVLGSMSRDVGLGWIGPRGGRWLASSLRFERLPTGERVGGLDGGGRLSLRISPTRPCSPVAGSRGLRDSGRCLPPGWRNCSGMTRSWCSR